MQFMLKTIKNVINFVGFCRRLKLSEINLNFTKYRRKSMILNRIEPVAKFRRPEKSMILGQFARAAVAARAPLTRPYSNE